MATHRSYKMRHSSIWSIYAAALLHQASLGRHASVISTQLTRGLRLPVIPSSLQPSNMIIDLCFVSFSYSLCTFLHGLLKTLPPLSPNHHQHHPPPPHLFLPLHFLFSFFSTLKSITSNLPISPTMTHTHTHRHTHGGIQAARAAVVYNDR